MNRKDQETVISFIENLPKEISYVITKDSEDETHTIGRDYVLAILKGGA